MPRQREGKSLVYFFEVPFENRLSGQWDRPHQILLSRVLQ